MQQTISFTKMHGLGNDFVMLSDKTVKTLGLCPDRNRSELEKLATFLCDRHFGVGADGLIFPAPASDPAYDIRFVYLNGDGSWAEMCGNGIRCFARFVKDLGIIKDDVFTVETLAGPIRPRINQDQTVTVDMGAPILEAAKIPVDPAAFGVSPDQQVQSLPVTVLDQRIPVTAISMGNPHCLVFQDDLPQPLDPAVFGPALEKHPAFPAKTNVEFVQVMNREHLKVTVWERGCGFTLACGTGACATAVGAIQLGKAEHNVKIELPGGSLNIQWDGNPRSSVLMSGPATYAFTGNIELPVDVLALTPA